jgi:hypothetical protein
VNTHLHERVSVYSPCERGCQHLITQSLGNESVKKRRRRNAACANTAVQNVDNFRFEIQDAGEGCGKAVARE